MGRQCQAISGIHPPSLFSLASSLNLLQQRNKHSEMSALSFSPPSLAVAATLGSTQNYLHQRNIGIDRAIKDIPSLPHVHIKD